MELPSKAIAEFKEIFRKEFDITLSDSEARERAESLMRLIVLILRPLPSETHRLSVPAQAIDIQPTTGTVNSLPLQRTSP